MSKLIKTPIIQSMIIELRGERVILDSDLAMLYQVPTKRLIEQIKRNIKRFPQDFMFKLTREEWQFLRSQIATFGRKPPAKKYLPYVFTRNGANMVCTVLRSQIAIHRSIQIMRAFSTLEEVISRKRKQAIQSPDMLKKLSTHSRAIMRLFQETKLNTKEVAKVKEIQKEMINLLQKMVFASLGKEN
jgi:hypothetical protein